MKKILLILIISCACFSGCSSEGEQYYGFYESPRGLSHKIFRHNLFGFEVDIPTAWTFGVAGQGPASVIMIYSPDIDTSKLASGYHALFVGVIPVEGVTLARSYEAIILGMRQAHADLAITKKPYETSLGGQNALHFKFEWPSKTGLFVEEDVFLVMKGQRTLSVVIRSIDLDESSIEAIYGDILPTFRVL